MRSVLSVFPHLISLFVSQIRDVSADDGSDVPHREGMLAVGDTTVVDIEMHEQPQQMRRERVGVRQPLRASHENSFNVIPNN